MFGYDQRERLLRESWDANGLSQELYAMFGPDVPTNTQAPVNITMPTGSTVAPITLNGAPATGPALVINRSDGTAVAWNNDGTVTATTPDGQSTPVSGGGGGGGATVPVWG